MEGSACGICREGDTGSLQSMRPRQQLDKDRDRDQELRGWRERKGSASCCNRQSPTSQWPDLRKSTSLSITVQHKCYHWGALLRDHLGPRLPPS